MAESYAGKGRTISGLGLIYSSPVHCNGNLLCAVDIETTGLDPEMHDIVDICILPLNSDFTPNKNVIPFNVKIRPSRPENIDPQAMKVNKIEEAELRLRGMDSSAALVLLRRWLAKINLPIGKKIFPVAQNYIFDKPFIQMWMGYAEYDDIFGFGFRDTLATTLFINDVFDFRGEKIPFPKNSLKYLSSQLRIINPAPHTALGDCVTTALIYRRLLELLAYGGLVEGAKRFKEVEAELIAIDQTKYEDMDILATGTLKELKDSVRAGPLSSPKEGDPEPEPTQ